LRNNPIHKKNWGALRSHHPDILRQLEDTKYDRSTCRTIISENGVPTIEVEKGSRKIYLSSKKNPLIESERIATSALDGTEQLVVLVGLGPGYTLRELLRQSINSLFVVIEPDPVLFLELVNTIDFSDIFYSKRVSIFIDPERLDYDEIAPHLSATNIKLLVSRPYRILYEKQVIRLEREFNSHQNTRRINIATLKRFDRLWTRNTFKNAPYFFRLAGIERIRDACTGIPAFVVAAGPSLEKDIDILNQHRSNAILIAVDTTLKPLLKRHILPDFVITVDPQLVNSHHLARVTGTTTQGILPVLVADPAVCTTTLRNYPGIKILTSSVFYPGKIIERFSGVKGAIAAGGSVATAAFDLARFAGSDPIVLMGLDLSFKGLKTHMDGSLVEEHTLSRSNRLKTVSNYLGDYVRSGKPSALRDKTGNVVLSDRRMLLYKSWFEQQMKDEKKTIINATRSGLSIRGIPDIQPDGLDRYIPRDPGKKSELIGQLRLLLRDTPVSFESLQSFKDYLHLSMKHMQDLQLICLRAEKLSQILLQNGTVREEKLLAEADARILSFVEENRLISMVMQSLINEILGTIGIVRVDSAMQNSIDLYRGMGKAAMFLFDVMKKTENKLSIINN
jgi:hypothetical protein